MVKKKNTIICPDDLEPTRLDQFLFTQFPDYSRSYFQKLITNELVTVDGKKVNKSFVVRPGMTVEFTFPEPPSFDVEPQDVDFEVLAIEDDFLVVNKPVGLTVHHSKSEGYAPTLVAGLLYRFKELEEFEDQERPGIVHRLDKNTSGLLIVARNEKALIGLSHLFKDREIDKTYLAVVKGHPEPKGEIALPIGRHPTQRVKMSHVSYKPKPALTKYEVVDYYKDCALVKVRLITGRTHQIRVHFAAIGHGLLGDSLYGSKSKMIKRQALHSWKISFTFREKLYSYTCPLAEDFKKLIETLEPTKVEPISR